MENKNKNHAYFLNLNPEKISSAFRLFRRLGIKPVFDENQYFTELREKNVNQITLLVHNKKAWTWAGGVSENKSEHLSDISPAEMLKILGLPAADKIPSVELNDLLKENLNDIYWLETDKNMPRTEIAGQCYQLGLIYENELEGLANYPWPTDRLLVINNKIYGSENIISEEIRKELGISSDKEIRTVRLNDLAKRHEEDIRLVQNDHSGKRNYPELSEERQTKAVTLAAIDADYQNVLDVPLAIIDQQIADAMAARDGKTLAVIPNEFITEAMCLNAVNDDGMALQYVPEKFYSDELFERAIENDGWALQFVPEQHKTKEMCQLALEQVLNMDYGGHVIVKYIPYPDIGLNIFKDAVDIYDASDVLKTFPKEIINKEIALEAIKQDINCFGLIPQDTKTSYFYDEAVKINGWMLQHVPEEMKTPQMCLAAKDASPDPEYEHLGLVAYVPFPNVCMEYLKEASGNIDVYEVFTAIRKDVLNPDIVQLAIDLDANCFKFVPDDLKTEELCLKVIKETGASGEVFDYIPEHLKTDQTYKLAVETNETALKWVPIEKRSYEMCLSAVERDGYQLEFVPERMKTEDICQIALDNCDKPVTVQGYNVISDIPYPDICLKAIEKFELNVEPLVLYGFINENVYNQSQEIARRAIQADGLCIGYIPDKFLNEELALTAVSNTYETVKVLSQIPDELCSLELCERIAKIQPSAIIFLPDEKITPELCLMALKNYNPTLYGEKDDTNLINKFPEEIKKGKNIFTFNQRLEKILTDKDKLTFTEVKDIYQGGTVKVQQVKNGEKILKNGHLSYDRRMDKFIITQGQRQEDKLSNPLLSLKKGKRI